VSARLPVNNNYGPCSAAFLSCFFLLQFCFRPPKKSRCTRTTVHPGRTSRSPGELIDSLWLTGKGICPLSLGRCSVYSLRTSRGSLPCSVLLHHHQGGGLVNEHSLWMGKKDSESDRRSSGDSSTDRRQHRREQTEAAEMQNCRNHQKLSDDFFFEKTGLYFTV
jgi:hypothetical protein